jgi:hypothetical protein
VHPESIPFGLRKKKITLPHKKIFFVKTKELKKKFFFANKKTFLEYGQITVRYENLTT